MTNFSAENVCVGVRAVKTVPVRGYRSYLRFMSPSRARARTLERFPPGQHPQIRTTTAVISPSWNACSTKVQQSGTICTHSARYLFTSRMLHLYGCNKWAAWPTLTKQKALRGMMPYWENTAIATPLGFTMWCWKEAKVHLSTATILSERVIMSESASPWAWTPPWCIPVKPWWWIGQLLKGRWWVCSLLATS